MTMLNNSGVGAEHSPNTEPCQFLKGLLAGSNMDDASRALKAIAHPLRLNIICELSKGEKSVQDILDLVGTSQSNVSQHLCLLRDKGIVASRKDANRVFYSIKNHTVKNIIGDLD